MNFSWKHLIIVAVQAALNANPKTRPIADEGAALAGEAEELFTSPGSGSQKLQHVVNGAIEAAQAVDELRGSPDEVAGPVSQALSAAIGAANKVKAALEAPAQSI